MGPYKKSEEELHFIPDARINLIIDIINSIEESKN
jgi:hypothetical protein